MKLVIQRVSRAKVSVTGITASEIGPGLLVLVGVSREDSESDAEYLAQKLTGLRIFEDAAGKMNCDVRETGGSVLIVSQFTLYADCRKGRRPSFERAASPADAVSLYDYFVAAVRRTGVPVETGVFQTSMEVELTNHGPVTIVIDSEDRKTK